MLNCCCILVELYYSACHVKWSDESDLSLGLSTGVRALRVASCKEFLRAAFGAPRPDSRHNALALPWEFRRLKLGEINENEIRTKTKTSVTYLWSISPNWNKCEEKWLTQSVVKNNEMTSLQKPRYGIGSLAGGSSGSTFHTSRTCGDVSPSSSKRMSKTWWTWAFCAGRLTFSEHFDTFGTSGWAAKPTTKLIGCKRKGMQWQIYFELWWTVLPIKSETRKPTEAREAQKGFESRNQRNIYHDS